MPSEPFPTGWGIEQVSNNESINIFNASMNAWSTAGGTDIPFVATLAIGIIPILVAGMIFIRFKKIPPALMGLLISTLLIQGVEVFFGVPLIIPWLYGVVYILTGFALAISLFFGFWNKN